MSLPRRRHSNAGKAFPKGTKARSLEFARQSPVAEVRERARQEMEER